MKQALNKLFILLAFVVMTATGIQAQVTIGSNKTPESFSVLELTTTIRKGGIRLPLLDTNSREQLDLKNLTDPDQKIMPADWRFSIRIRNVLNSGILWNG